MNEIQIWIWCNPESMCLSHMCVYLIWYFIKRYMTMRNSYAFHVGFSIDKKEHNIIVKCFFYYIKGNEVETQACIPCITQSLPKQSYTCLVHIPLNGRGGSYNHVYENTHMMTSSNGNIFHITGHLCGEFNGPRWIPRTKASDAELWCLLWSASE